MDCEDGRHVGLRPSVLHPSRLYGITVAWVRITGLFLLCGSLNPSKRGSGQGLPRYCFQLTIATAYSTRRCFLKLFLMVGKELKVRRVHNYTVDGTYNDEMSLT